MTDRELLEAAAKAASVEYEPRYAEPAGVKPRGLLQPSGIANISPTWWNPLTDDGDALRLAVKLGLLHTYDMDQVVATVHFDATDPDPYAATRRAIVRAAAALAVG